MLAPIGFTLLVGSYDHALKFYVSALRLFRVEQDTDMGNGRRFVYLRFHVPTVPFAMTLMLPANAIEQALVGKQAGNSILLVFPVADLEMLVQQLESSSVRFDTPIMNLPYGRQAICVDPFGNRISLLETYTFE
jgi:predicted enzyme related to lactoylglutathione lyase